MRISLLAFSSWYRSYILGRKCLNLWRKMIQNNDTKTQCEVSRNRNNKPFWCWKEFETASWSLFNSDSTFLSKIELFVWGRNFEEMQETWRKSCSLICWCLWWPDWDFNPDMIGLAKQMHKLPSLSEFVCSVCLLQRMLL